MIWRMMVAVVLAVVVGVGVWQGARHYLQQDVVYTQTVTATPVQPIDDGAGPDEGTAEYLNATEQVASLSQAQLQTGEAAPVLSEANAYKAKRYGLIVALISLPFLMLFLLPGAKKSSN